MAGAVVVAAMVAVSASAAADASCAPVATATAAGGDVAAALATVAATVAVEVDLDEAGQQHGIQNAGYRAIESLRLEKGYRAWSADIGPDHTPFESGLGWAVKLKTDIEFKGKAAIKQQVKNGVKKMLACFTIENPDVILLGRETIYRNGHRVGWLSSGGFGYTAGLPIGYGYVRCAEGVDADYIRAGEYEIEVSTQRIKATVHMKPLYDPDMKRVKC